MKGDNSGLGDDKYNLRETNLDAAYLLNLQKNINYKFIKLTKNGNCVLVRMNTKIRLI